MKKIGSIFFFILLVSSMVMAQVPKHKRAYKLYNKSGKKVSYRKMVKQLAKADVVLFGELHNNPIAHWMELTLAKDLHQKREIVLGTELLERDQQSLIDDYLAGRIDAKAMDTLAKTLPVNYKTDYKPLVDFAKKEHLVFVGSNIPRRFARIVYRKGFEGLDELSKKEKDWVAPLPIEYDPNLKSYQEMIGMMGGHGGDNLPKAQAIKDATMAHFIIQYLQKGKLFFHVNGSYHSDQYEGIVWYLKKKVPELKVKTISVVAQKDINKLDKEAVGIADFIIVVDEDMTTTY
ncbi:MAG TPA: iron-regulated protein [Saprospiraceae bacterium]|nr:iron-regulated protein [Saprospiraceae bacterium]